MVESQLQKVKNHILSQIGTGKWRLDEKISSEFELVRELSISRSTVNRALKELTNEGYLVRRQGLGSFVSNTKTKYTLLEIKSISDEISDQNGTHKSKIITLSEQKANQYIGGKLEVKEGTKVFHSRILHYFTSEPLQLAERYINPRFAPNYLNQDFTKITPSEYLFSLGMLTEVEHLIEAAAPDSATRKILDLKSNEPCLIIHRRTWSKNMVVNYAKLIHPASRYTPSGRFTPKNNPLGIVV